MAAAWRCQTRARARRRIADDGTRPTPLPAVRTPSASAGLATGQTRTHAVSSSAAGFFSFPFWKRDFARSPSPSQWKIRFPGGGNSGEAATARAREPRNRDGRTTSATAVFQKNTVFLHVLFFVYFVCKHIRSCARMMSTSVAVAIAVSGTLFQTFFDSA